MALEVLAQIIFCYHLGRSCTILVVFTANLFYLSAEAQSIRLYSEEMLQQLHETLEKTLEKKILAVSSLLVQLLLVISDDAEVFSEWQHLSFTAAVYVMISPPKPKR